MITDNEIKKSATERYGNGKHLTDKEEGFREGAKWALKQVKNCSIPDVVESDICPTCDPSARLGYNKCLLCNRPNLP